MRTHTLLRLTIGCFLLNSGWAPAAEEVAEPAPGAYLFRIFTTTYRTSDGEPAVDSEGLLVISAKPISSSTLPAPKSESFKTSYWHWYAVSPYDFRVCIALGPGSLRSGTYALRPVTVSGLHRDKGKLYMPFYRNHHYRVDFVITKTEKNSFEGEESADSNLSGGGAKFIAFRKSEPMPTITDCLEEGQRAWEANSAAQSAWSGFEAWKRNQEPEKLFVTARADGSLFVRYGFRDQREISAQDMLARIEDPANRIGDVYIKFERKDPTKLDVKNFEKPLKVLCEYTGKTKHYVLMYYLLDEDEQFPDMQPLRCDAPPQLPADK